MSSTLAESQLGVRAAVFGALLGLGLGMPAVALPLAAGATLIGSLGIAGALIGWTWGPLTPTRSQAGRLGLMAGVALSATVLGAACVSLALTVFLLPGPNGYPAVETRAEVATTFLGYWLHGLWFAGLPSLLATFPLAMLWRWLVGRQGSGPGERRPGSGVAADPPTASQVVTEELRRTGAKTGAAVGAVAAAIALTVFGAVWLTTTEDATVIGRDLRYYVETVLWTSGFVAVVSSGGAIVGRLFGPRTLGEQGRSTASLVFKVAASATLLGALEISMLFAMAGSVGMAVRSGDPFVLAAFPLFFLGLLAPGLIFFGLPSLLATIPTAYVWYVLMRSLGDERYGHAG